MPLSTVEAAIADFKAGKFVIIVDDEDRENEGDLAIAAEFATPEAINFMAQEGRGLICAALAPNLIDRLQLPLMVPSWRNESGFGTNFTVSVEARDGVTTGISAYDRARTVQVLIDPASRPQDVVMPGHIFPLRAQADGVLARRGQTEASVDLARLAGLVPAAVICEVMADDGRMARLPQLQELAEQHDLKIISVEALVKYRRQQAGVVAKRNGMLRSDEVQMMHSVTRVAKAQMPTRHGFFQVFAYRDAAQNEHLVLRRDSGHNSVPLVRVHSACLTGDLLGSLRCDCGDQLDAALGRIAQVENGMLIYLQQEGRGIGLANKIRAYALQDAGLDTVEANVALGFPPDGRDFGLAAAILRDQDVHTIRLMTNNPRKIAHLVEYGIDVVEHVSHEVGLRAENESYLRAKAEKLAHDLSLKE